MVGVLVAAALAVASPDPVTAQDAAWNATLVVQPLPSPFVAEWERNPQTAMLTVVYNGQSPADYRIEVEVRDGRGDLLGRGLSQTHSFAFGPVSRFFNVGDALGWETVESRDRYVDLAMRSGVLPEGGYRLCTRVRNADTDAVLTEACQRFEIALPDPPQLMLPAEGAEVVSTRPTFQWTPVSVPAAIGTIYRIRLVERLPGQTPRRALDANVTHFETDASVPMLVYPFDALPLEEGREYVWRVEVLNADGRPITTGERRSEVRVFTYRGPETSVVAGVDDVELPDSLTLIPGLARISGLHSVDVDETAFAYTVNGWLELRLAAPYDSRLRVEARDLEIRKGSFAPPTLTGGRLLGRLSAGDLASALPDGIEPVDLAYSPDDGLTVSARLALTGAEGDPVRLDGRARLTLAGVSGRLSAAAAVDGGSLVTLGDDPVRVRVQRANVTLPAGDVRVTGALDLFDADVGCDEITGTIGAGGALSINVACSPRFAVPLLGQGAGGPRLTLATVAGSVDADLAALAAGGSGDGSVDDDALDYALDATARIDLGEHLDACGGRVRLALGDGDVEASGFRPQCGVLAAGDTTNLDWLAFEWGGLRLERLAYIRDQGFDFVMYVDAQPLAADLVDLELPSLPEIRVTDAGMAVPAIDEPLAGEPVTVGGFGVSVTRVSTSAFTLPWSDWSDGTADRFSFELDLAMTLPELPAGSPACLATETFAADRAVLSAGRIQAELADRVYDPGCPLPVAGDARLLVERIGGELDVRFSPDVAVDARPRVAGEFELPSTFACDADPTGGAIRVGDEGLGLGPRGGLVGRIEGVAPDCPLDWTVARVWFDGAALDLGVDAAGEQSAVLSGAAEATFAAPGGTGVSPAAPAVGVSGDTITGTGSLAVDLITGELIDGQAVFQGPLRFDIPRDDPAMTFRISRLRIDTAGVRIDGRNPLMLPDGDSIRATFANLVLEPYGGVRSGTVHFDTPFAFEVGVDAQTDEMDWRVVATGAPLGVASGLRVDLPTGIEIGPDGFGATGESTARIVYGGHDLQNVTSIFSSDFLVGFQPFAVTDGRLDLRVDDVGVGYIDASGFHPSLTYLAGDVVPGRLPLPSEDVAYLELRQGGQDDGALLVNSEQTAQGTRLYTDPGDPVLLVMPSLELGRAQTPALEVEIDLTVDPLGENVDSGYVVAAVPANEADAFDLSGQGVPFAIDTVAYRSAGQAGYRLELMGRPKLFDRTHGPDGAATLAIDGMGDLTGTLALPVDQRVRLMPSSENLVLAVDSVAGSFDAELLGGDLDYTVDVIGGLELALALDSVYRADAALRATRHGIGLEWLDLPGGATGTLDLGGFGLGIENLNIPVLAYDPVSGWDFEIVLDAAPVIEPLGGLELPTVAGISIRPDGVGIPELSIPNMSVGSIDLGGFELEPLAFRMDSLTVDWFDGGSPSDWGFEFDLALTLPDLPSGAPPELRNGSFTILGAGFGDGVFTGTIEPRDFLSPIHLPLGGFDFGLAISGLAGTLGADPQGDQDLTLALDADLRLPDYMRCPTAPDGAISAPSGTFTLSTAGGVNATLTDVVPECPLVLGPLAVHVTGSDLVLAAGIDGQEATLDVDGTVRLPGPAEGDTVSASGNLVLDLLVPEVTSGSIAIDQPFVWALPEADDPFLTFVVSQGRLDPDGLVLAGTGDLAVGPQTQDTVGVDFNDLTFSLPDLALTDGSVSFDAPFALEGRIDGGSIDWRTLAANQSRPDPTEPGMLVTLPAGVTLDSDGLSATGTAGAELAYADSSLASLSVEFLNDFLLGIDPVGVTTGRASFVLNGDEIAYADSLGFHPGDFFGVLPVPARLGLPAEDVAYITLRDESDDVLVESADTADGLRISTPAGQTVDLVVPALAEEGQQAPSTEVAFSVVVDPQSYAVVSGGIEATAPDDGPGLLDLAGLGVPVEVRRIRYASASAYELTVDLDVTLPGELSDLDVVFEDLALGPNGLEGEATVGDGATPIASVDVGGAVTVTVDTAFVTFGPDPAAGIGGGLASDVFADVDELPDSIGYDAAVDASTGVAFAVDDPGVLPLGAATFDPQQVGLHEGIEVTATDDEFTVRFSGVLEMPSVSEEFALTVDGLEVGTGGVVFPSMSLASTDQQSFELFGAAFTLMDVGEYDALALSWDAGTDVLSATMSGELDFLDNTTSFTGFTVGSDGTLAVASANLLGDPVSVVPNVLRLTALGIENDMLRADFGVTPPAPFDGRGEQDGYVRIAADGTVDGGSDITLLDEARLEVAPSSAPTDEVLALGGAITAHPRHLGLEIDFADVQGGSAVELVADVYLHDDLENRIQLGTGPDSVGLRVGFDGSVVWDHFVVADTIEFDHDVVRLAFADIYAVPGDAFGLGFSADLALATSQVESDLSIGNVEITTAGVGFENAAFYGGSLSIAGVLGVTVDAFDYSASPTTISVPAGGMPAGADQAPSAETNDVSVASYIRLGGSVDIAGGAFSGGVDELLAYTTAGTSDVTLLVDNAHLAVGGAGAGVTMDLDLFYQEDGGDFSVLVGGGASVAGQDVFQAVGEVGRTGDDVNLGVFFVTSVEVPVVPPNLVVLTSVGGGFFYNPTPQALALVESYAQVSNEASSAVADATSGNASWAAFLYGSASIVGETVANGRMLMTVRPARFELAGAVDVLCVDGAACSTSLADGEAGLVVGFDPLYVDGNLDLTVDYSGLVSGGVDARFFITSATYGVMGDADIDIVGVVDGQGEFYFGPPGFMTAIHVGADLDFWIVSVNTSFDAEMWYMNDPGVFGAYMEIYIGASVLGGTVTAKGNMYAALISGNSFYVYGVASLSVSVTFAEWSGSVWAKFRNGNVSGGFNADSEMEELIGDMRQSARDMRDAKDAAVDELQASLPPSSLLRLSDVELASIHDRLAGLSEAEFDALYQQARDLETGPIGYDENGQRQSVSAPSIPWSYLDWYRDVLRRVGATTVDSATLARYADTVDVRIARLDGLESDVRTRLDDLDVQVDELQSMADSAWSLQSPVVSASLDREPTFDDQGRLIDGPGFDVDAAAAQDAQDQLTAREQAAQDLDRQVRNRIDAVETALADLRTALTESGRGSVLAYARLQAQTVEAAERHYAEQANAVLERRDWARDTHAELTAQEGAVENVLEQRTVAVRDRAGLNNGEVARQLSDARVGVLDAWDGNDTIFVTYEQDTQSLSAANMWDQAYISGMQTWYGVADAGLQAIDTAAASVLDSIGYAADQRLGGLRERHETVSRELDRLFLAHAEMTGTLYDLYDRYEYWHGDGTPTVPDADEISAMLNRAATRKQELEQELQVPDAGNVIVSVYRQRSYMTRVRFMWSGSHPSGIDELRYLDASDEGAKTPVLMADRLYSIGVPDTGGLGLGTVHDAWHYPDSPGQTQEDRSVLYGSRGGAGYVGLGRAGYTITYAAESTDPIGSTTGYSTDADSTPPSQPSVWFPDAGRSDAYAPYSWTGDSTQVAVEWAAYDDETGIGGYRYAFAENGNVGDTVSVVGGRTSALIEDLNLHPDSVYSVIAWARNGDGVWGDSGSSHDLRYDPTPPTFPAGAELEGREPSSPTLLTGGGGFAFSGYGGSTYGNPYEGLNDNAVAPCAVSEPAYPGAALFMAPVGMTLTPIVVGADTPSITIERPDASDPESGVANYYLHVGPAPAESFVGDWNGAPGWLDWTSVGDTLTLSGPPLNFTDSLYVSLVAVNWAGDASEPLVYGPFQVPDDSPPTQPEFCGRMGGNGKVVMRVERGSVDGESGVRGVAYRLRDTGTTVVRSWPDSVDWTDVDPGDVRTIPGASFVDGQSYYVDVLAENGQGERSSIRATGPVLYDGSPPPRPTASATLGDYDVEIEVDAPDDPHSGLMSVQYAVYDGSEPVIGWASASPPAHGGTFTISVPRPIAMAGIYGLYDLKVRTVNGVGEPSTIYETTFGHTLQDEADDQYQFNPGLIPPQ